MSDERRAWLGMIRDVGVAFGDLARAELAAIADDLGRSGSALVRALIVAAVAAACAFWTLGLAIYLPALHPVFHTRALPWRALGLLAVASSAPLILTELAKRVARDRDRPPVAPPPVAHP